MSWWEQGDGKTTPSLSNEVPIFFRVPLCKLILKDGLRCTTRDSKISENVSENVKNKLYGTRIDVGKNHPTTMCGINVFNNLSNQMG